MGDMVNRFVHGSLVMRLPDSELANVRTLLFGTISGAIGLLASLPKDDYVFFERLQVGCCKVDVCTGISISHVVMSRVRFAMSSMALGA